MSRSCRNRPINYCLPDSDQEDDLRASSSKSLTCGRSSRNESENADRRFGKRAKLRCSKNKGKKRPKRDIVYSISSDSDDTDVGIGPTTNSNRTTTDCSEETRNDQEEGASPLSHSNLEALAVAHSTPNREDAPDVLNVNNSLTTKCTDLEREFADLIAESNRLIADCEASFVNLSSPRPTREVIDLIASPASQVIDLTDSVTSAEKPSNILEHSAEKQNIPECPVCYEKLNKRLTSVTPCGHYFCTACIKKSLAAKKKCPTCRKKCLPKQLYPLYLFSS